MIKGLQDRRIIDYIDASGMATFNRCPSKYYFERVVGLKLPSSGQIALDYGTDIHFALPSAFKDPEEALRIFTDRWGRRPYGNEDPKRNVARAYVTFQLFNKQRNEHTCPYTIMEFDFTEMIPDEADKISDFEVPFIIDINGDLPLAGRIDLPVILNLDGTTWALDWKTASEISPRYWKNFENATQCNAYTLALGHLTHKPVAGMIIEALRSSPSRAEVSYQPIHISDINITNFIECANYTSQEILECNEKRNWRQKCTGCAPYAMFGTVGYQCPYLELCNAPDWQAQARFYDKEEPFHPFKMDNLKD